MDLSTLFQIDIQQGIWDTQEEIDNTPTNPTTNCVLPLSEVPSKYFVAVASGFCAYAGDLKSSVGPVGFDIYGNKIPIMKEVTHFKKRTPPTTPDTYKDFKFFLSWTPASGICLLNQDTLCTDAYNTLVQSDCKYTI